MTQALKNNKSPGDDGIPTEVYKALGRTQVGHSLVPRPHPQEGKIPLNLTGGGGLHCQKV